MELNMGHDALASNWGVTSLGSEGTIFSGLTGKSKQDFGIGDSLYVPFTNVIGNVVVDCQALEAVRVEPSETQYRVRKGDLLFNGSSETAEEVALCALMDADVPNVYLNSFCFGYRLKPDSSFVPRFLAYLFRSAVGREAVKALAQGSTRYNIAKTAFLKAPIPAPPIKEQRAILAALDDISALLGSINRLLAKKRDLKQAAMQQLLGGQTRLPGFAGTWEETTLGDLFAFKNGLNKAKRYFGFGKPIVNFMDVMKNPSITSAMLRGRVSLSSDEVAQYEVRRGDVLFTRTSETREEIGMSSVVLDELRDTVFSGFVLRARPKNDALCTQFSAYCFRQSAVRKQIVASASYTTRALTNGRMLSAVTVRLPDKSEQTAIATVLSDMDAELAALEARLEKTKALKQAMMQELLTGRTRLVAPEPAHA